MATVPGAVAFVSDETGMPKLNANASKKAKRERVHDELHKFKVGELHSGSKQGPLVKGRKQAIAIALSEAGESRGQRHGNKHARKRTKTKR